MVVCITVSTNYDNLLNIILPQNSKFFKKWYIVTAENDHKTLEVINKYHFDNIEVLYFDFYKNSSFNKGGAIDYALNMIEEGETVLLLDSDIYITDEFLNYIDYPLEYDIIYSFKRYNYYTYSNFINDIHDNIYNVDFMGFFQLFKNNKKHHYADSHNCSTCDLDFYYGFNKGILLDGKVVKHLGREAVNHDGRKCLDDFIMN